MSFKHIIITRFNLSNRWEKDKHGNQVLNETWLNQRYLLFEQYCLPSMKSQTNQNFEWWVYFDSETDPYYKMKNENLMKVYSNFKPKYEKSYVDFEENMPQDIHSNLISKGIVWLITTRLDNDDVLADNTVEVIQNKQNFKDNTLLEIPYGYTLEKNKIFKLRKVESYLNPFISYVEEISLQNRIKSVYYYQHNQWIDVNRIVVSTKEQWMQVIHDQNVSNKAIGKEVFYNDGIYKRFKIQDNDLRFQPYLIFLIRRLKLKLRSFYSKQIKRLK